MTLRPTLTGPCDLLAKLERERYRAIHHEHMLHKADHFYNFCVTSWSMADYLRKAGHSGHAKWLSDLEIAATRDVANTAKHFSLDYTPKTVSVSQSVTPIVHFYKTDRGEIIHVLDEKFPDLSVMMDDGSEFGMWGFMDDVIEYWRAELKVFGFTCPNQSADDLHGRTDE